MAVFWKVPKSKARDPRRKVPKETWYLATSLEDPKSAAAWYWQRGWIEQSFKDSKGRFGLGEVRVGSAERLSRLLAALTMALSWLTLAALPEIGALPEGFHAAVSGRGRASVISLGLALSDELGQSTAILLTSTNDRWLVGMRQLTVVIDKWLTALHSAVGKGVEKRKG